MWEIPSTPTQTSTGRLNMTSYIYVAELSHLQRLSYPLYLCDQVFVFAEEQLRD